MKGAELFQLSAVLTVACQTLDVLCHHDIDEPAFNPAQQLLISGPVIAVAGQLRIGKDAFNVPTVPIGEPLTF
nr:hypothetical protein [Sulfitobacter sp. W002]